MEASRHILANLAVLAVLAAVARAAPLAPSSPWCPPITEGCWTYSESDLTRHDLHNTLRRKDGEAHARTLAYIKVRNGSRVVVHPARVCSTPFLRQVEDSVEGETLQCPVCIRLQTIEVQDPVTGGLVVHQHRLRSCARSRRHDHCVDRTDPVWDQAVLVVNNTAKGTPHLYLHVLSTTCVAEKKRNHENDV
ncbi:uncharacterized protein LOC117642446 [Thrips palmi]|uniref:Uncharacterized protein LOC117642446 n=1 Tax=Thrips palmi TaxID=161013 RepID=A0A6P8ZK67_THRPL|nr:uncharacterized protein LOC117642446 [Thrips palmi]